MNAYLDKSFLRTIFYFVVACLLISGVSAWLGGPIEFNATVFQEGLTALFSIFVPLVAVMGVLFFAGLRRIIKGDSPEVTELCLWSVAFLMTSPASIGIISLMKVSNQSFGQAFFALGVAGLYVFLTVTLGQIIYSTLKLARNRYLSRRVFGDIQCHQ